MNEVSAIIVRLKNAFNVHTHAELADKLGISPHTVSVWKRRKAVPEKIILKCSQMTNISVNWLNTGRGEMKRENIQPYQHLQHGEEIEINYYPEVYASAGYGAINDNPEVETITVSKFFINTLRIDNIKNIDIIRIYGDSMEPDFHNGEYVIVERVNSIEEVDNGNTVIANISGDIYIKKIEKVPFQKGIILNPRNTSYEPIKVESHNLSELNIVGIVRGSITPH